MSKWSDQIEKRAEGLGLRVELASTGRYVLIERGTGDEKGVCHSWRQLESTLVSIRLKKMQKRA